MNVVSFAPTFCRICPSLLDTRFWSLGRLIFNYSYYGISNAATTSPSTSYFKGLAVEEVVECHIGPYMQRP